MIKQYSEADTRANFIDPKLAQQVINYGKKLNLKFVYITQGKWNIERQDRRPRVLFLADQVINTFNHYEITQIQIKNSLTTAGKTFQIDIN